MTVFAAVYPLLTTRALEEPFDYLVPDELAAVRRGSVVAVRLGAQTVLGVVLELRDASPHTGRLLPHLERGRRACRARRAARSRRPGRATTT